MPTKKDKPLGDPDREAETRALLPEHSAVTASPVLKALLKSAPLDGIDLTRERDAGRDVDL